MAAGLAYTRDFVTTLFTGAKEVVARGLALKDAMAHIRRSMDPKFGQVFIYEHCLPFDVTRAVDGRAASNTRASGRRSATNVARPAGRQ